VDVALTDGSRLAAGGLAMKQLLAWIGSADSTITSEAVMAMAEKFNTGQEVCLQIPSARRVMQVKESTSGS
jgi:chitinase